MKQRKIAQLKKELEKAMRVETGHLADEIRTRGFECRHCAHCCKAEYGDNTVSVFPFEIRLICERTGLEWNDIVIPTPSEDRDTEGNIHTFEWVLRKKGDCIFLKDNLCEIYESRPYICRTYPFYLSNGRLKVCECDGPGDTISSENSRLIAEILKERYIFEIKESISLLEKFSGFNPGGKGNVCVHDSDGEHWIY